MKNMINVNQLRKSHVIESLNYITLNELSDEAVHMIEAEIKDACNPLYRVWYYQKKNWPTGYSSTDLHFLETAFRKMRKNLRICNSVLNKQLSLF